jgi:hypothetical protein
LESLVELLRLRQNEDAATDESSKAVEKPSE